MLESESLRETISRIYDWKNHTEPMLVFSDAMLDVEKLSGICGDSSCQGKHYQLLYANVITALETYLLDTFVLTLFKDESFKNSLLSNSSDFKSEKYTLKEFCEMGCDVDTVIKEKLFNMSWHNLSKAEVLYLCSFGVKFPVDREILHKAVLTRHNIIHRNGRSKDGEEIFITKDDWMAL